MLQWVRSKATCSAEMSQLSGMWQLQPQPLIRLTAQLLLTHKITTGFSAMRSNHSCRLKQKLLLKARQLLSTATSVSPVCTCICHVLKDHKCCQVLSVLSVQSNSGSRTLGTTLRIGSLPVFAYILQMPITNFAICCMDSVVLPVIASSGTCAVTAPAEQLMQHQKRGSCLLMALLYAGRSSASDQRWLQQVRESGTVSDKLAAMTLLLQVRSSLAPC